METGLPRAPAFFLLSVAGHRPSVIPLIAGSRRNRRATSAVHLRQVDVQKHHVGPEGERLFQSGLAVMRKPDVMA